MREGLRIWITRAEPGASRTAARLSELGHTPVVQPLLAIQPLSDVILPDLTQVAALAFTSPNGVAAFAALTAEGRALPCYCVGDATALAAREQGFAQAQSAQGDINDLAKRIAQDRLNGPLLAPGAREPAGDLPSLLPHLSVQRLPVYAAVETGLPAPDPFDLVLIHSPRAARALAQTLTPSTARQTCALAISEAATAPIRALEFKEIHISLRPDETSMLCTLGKRV